MVLLHTKIPVSALENAFAASGITVITIFLIKNYSRSCQNGFHLSSEIAISESLGTLYYVLS